MKMKWVIIRVHIPKAGVVTNTPEGPEAIGPFNTYGLAKKYWQTMEEAGIYMGDKWISPIRPAFK